MLLYHKDVNNGLGIKSVVDTFVHYLDGHNALAHPLKFDKLPE